VQQIEPAAAGELLVEQHDRVRLATQHHERVVAVRRLRDGEALLLEEVTVGGETPDLVVHPEDRAGTRHGPVESYLRLAGAHNAVVDCRVLRVLVVRFSSIGDVLLTTPLVRALRRRHPDADVTFVTKRALAPLVSDNPHLTRVAALEPDEPLRHLARRLTALQPTHGLDLHGSLRSAALRALVRCRWSGYRKRKLARTLLITAKLDRYGDAPPVPERYFEAARGLDVRPDGGPPELHLGTGAQDRVAAWLAGRGLAEAPLAALAPGAAHATKRWPVRHWVDLATRLGASGYRCVIVGGAGDRGIAAQVPAAASAAGEFSLQETGALLARARVAVSGDTGVMHIATAVGTPVVALFGPTVRQFGFFPYGARATVVQRDLPCRPCSAMGTARCPLGHHRCLADIPADEVQAAVARLVA
jgi:heptosyltransferase-2